MKRACIAIVDTTRARIYRYEERDGAPELDEEVNLANLGRENEDEAGIANLDGSFAKFVISELARVVHEHSYQRVIIAAAPRMLGRLRAVAGYKDLARLELAELPNELLKLSTAQLHEHLADLNFIAPRRRLAAVAR